MQSFANSVGWKESGPIVDAEVGAVHLRADARQARQHQQPDADRGDHVAVALERPQSRRKQDRRGEQHDAERRTSRLLARERVVDPVDHHQPEGREQRDQREQVRVGVGQRVRMNRCAARQSARKKPP